MPNPSGAARLVFERPDGGVSIDAPVARIADDAELLAAHIVRMETAHGWTHRANITAAELRSSRRLRNAWRWVGSGLDVDLPTGREILMTELRVERDTKLAETDGEVLRDQERSQPDIGLRDYRQALRDLPATAVAEVEAITDATALENWQPTWPARVG